MISARFRVGLISDTHGHVDPRVHTALAGVDVVLHAGDVCGDGVLYELQAIAGDLRAVSGNCDVGAGAWGLEPIVNTVIARKRFFLIHDLKGLAVLPPEVDVVVHGHTHRPEVRHSEGVWFVNPGSASQRRRMPSRSVAIVDIDEGAIQPHVIMLDAVAAPTP